MSSNSKQKTLFQSWNNSNRHMSTTKPLSAAVTQQALASQPCCSKKLNDDRSVTEISSDEMDDEALLSAAVAMEDSDYNLLGLVTDNDEVEGFDKFSGNLWIYPTNYPVRNYQLSIVKTALFKNTLVALPTGLGKTFIAAVVLYNYYRWYPQGKIVFMAPTKPLVSQQIEACYNIMGIPMEDQVILTGSTMASNRRSELWKSKRVFFLTPQVINNDLTRGVCPASAVKCLVVDEAHKALGNHAYCQVVQQLLSHTRNFRVLALSATPGSDLKTVQQVIKNLLISQIEVRSEDSIDIKQYTHARSVEKVVVKLTDQIIKLKERYLNVIQTFINNLVNNKAIYNKDVSYLSKYALLMAREQFRKDPPSGLSRHIMGTIEGTFAISISLYHGLELLLQHGMKSFFIFLKGIMEGGKGSMRSKACLHANPDFRSIYDELTGYYGENPDSVVLCTQANGTQHSSKIPRQGGVIQNVPYIYSHPKMKRLEEVVVQHFQEFSKGNVANHETRVMVFCQYRDNVREVTELLQMHRPLIRPMQFVGHAPSTNPSEEDKSKPSRRFTQKDQLMVVSKFRSGDYNTLVSTCVGEEGLDIGDVDLIVCFDSHKSPIRLVQRMGRTGRKRKGKIVMLVTEGKEERDYNSSLASRRSIHKAIAGAGKTLQYYSHNPPMIPKGLHPQCHKMFITVQTKTSTNTKKESVLAKKEPKRSTSDIGVLLKNSKNSIFLNEAEKQKWRDSLMLSTIEQRQLKTLPPTGRCLYLQKELWSETSSSRSNIMSLSEWLPWQSRLQKTYIVGHSSRCKMFSEILNVCDALKECDDSEIDRKYLPPGGKILAVSTGIAHKISTQENIAHFFMPNIADKSKLFSNNENCHKISKSVSGTTRKNTKLKKERKKIIVISDDEDFCMPDIDSSLPSLKTAFSNFPELNTCRDRTENTVTAIDSTPLADKSDSAEDKQKETSVSQQIVKKYTPTNVTSEESFVVKNQEKVEKNCKVVKHNRAFSDSNSLSIAANISPLFSVSDDENEIKLKSVKVSKTESTVCVDVDHISRRILDLDALDFSKDADDQDVVEERQTKEKKCFKLWSSDEENPETFSEPNNVFKFAQASNEHDNSPTILNTINDQSGSLYGGRINIGRISDASSSNLDIYNNASSVINVPESSCLKSMCIAFPNNTVKTMTDVAGDARSSEAKQPIVQNALDGAKESFDMSADMFATQFDLDFDLGFETLGKSTSKPNVSEQQNANIMQHKAPSAEICKSDLDKVGKYPVLYETDSLNYEVEESRKVELETHITEDKSCISPRMVSFDLSQAKRMENRKLFADLNCNTDSKLPFAKVKPQRITSQNVAPHNIFPKHESVEKVINISELTEVKNNFKKLRRKRLFSNTCAIVKSDNVHIDDDDDFKSSPALLKRRRISKNCDFGQSPEEDLHSPVFLPKKAFACPILSSDNSSSSDVEPPFTAAINDSGEISSFSNQFEVAQSPILTASAKRKKRRNRFTDIPLNQDQIACSKESEKIKHSTPKATLIEKSSTSEHNVSDESFVVKRFYTKQSEKHPKYKNQFLCNEAEVSNDGARISSDEEDEDEVEDKEMIRFINDATQLTQHSDPKDLSVNEQAMYLRSVRTSGTNDRRAATDNLNGRYKLVYNVGNDIDVFSQVPEEDISDYIEDSFCVNDESDEKSADLGEVTLLESQMMRDEFMRRPRTRAQVGVSKEVNQNVSRKPKRGKRLIVCEDDSTTDIESEDNLPRTWMCNACTFVNPSISRCKMCDQSYYLNTHASSSKLTASPSQRLCEVCGGVLSNKGWMCKDCMSVMKRSEADAFSIPPDHIPSSANVPDKKGTANPTTSSIKMQTKQKLTKFPVNISMTRAERLAKSREKQKELRARLNIKKNSPITKSGNMGKPKTSACSSDASFDICSKFNVDKRNPDSHRVNFDKSLFDTSEKYQNPKHTNKLVILLDSKEINGGATWLVQELRTTLKMNAHVASLQCCSYVISNRCAVIRKTVDDITTSSKRQKLKLQLKQAHLQYKNLILIVEKDRVKTGFASNRSSAAQIASYISTIVALSHQGGLKILYSNDQKQTAGLLHYLACKESTAGYRIDPNILITSSNEHQLFGFYQSIPGISWLDASYLTYHFKSLKIVLNSSLNFLVQKAHLSIETAENLMKFLKKKFDIQMTPL